MATAVVELSDRRLDSRSAEPVGARVPGVSGEHDFLAATARTLKTGPLIAAGAPYKHNAICGKLFWPWMGILHRYAERRFFDEAEPNEGAQQQTPEHASPLDLGRVPCRRGPNTQSRGKWGKGLSPLPDAVRRKDDTWILYGQ